jgi:tryptophan synthase alpha chain
VSRVREAFARGKAFIPFVVAGDPTLAATPAILAALARAGADAIEVGVPFSDPVADGPVIQRASARARAATLRRVVEALPRFRAEHATPLILFTYLNPLLAHGRRHADAGEALRRAADAVLVVDLPLDGESGVDLGGLERVVLAAPSTSEERLRRLVAAPSPFVYYVSRYGVTGARGDVPEDLGERVARIRAVAGKPVAVGFGVSTPEQARAVARVADGVVVGSAIVERIERGAGPDDVFSFARELADAVHGA